jgi:hypothetical protein
MHVRAPGGLINRNVCLLDELQSGEMVTMANRIAGGYLDQAYEMSRRFHNAQAR